LSESKIQYRDHSQNAKKLKPTVSTYGLQASNFHLGDPQKEYAYFSTNYAKENDAGTLNKFVPQPKVEPGNQKSNIHFGKKLFVRASHNHRTYGTVKAKDLNCNNSFTVKGNNFEIGDPNLSF